MYAHATKFLLGEKTTKNASPLHIVIVFDHLDVATAVREMLGRFIGKWAADVDVHRDEWSFAELEHPKCRSEASELARSCDMLVIAISEDDLPASFNDWLEHWASARDQNDVALILLVAANGAGVSSFSCCASLPDFARQHGLAFFSTVIAPAARAVVPRFLHPKELLTRLAIFDAANLPDFSGLND